MDLQDELIEATKKGLKVSFMVREGVLYTEVTGRKPSDVLYTERKGARRKDCNLAQDLRELVYSWEVQDV